MHSTLGYPINGLVVTGTTNLNVPLLQDMCEAWLSGRLEINDFVGCGINMSWLQTLNSMLVVNADREIMERFARVYMLRLLGSKVMLDKTSSAIHEKYLPLLLQLDQYSWVQHASLCYIEVYAVFHGKVQRRSTVASYCNSHGHGIGSNFCVPWISQFNFSDMQGKLI